MAEIAITHIHAVLVRYYSGLGLEIGAISLRRKNRKDQMEACSLIEILLYEELELKGTESCMESIILYVSLFLLLYFHFSISVRLCGRRLAEMTLHVHSSSSIDEFFLFPGSTNKHMSEW
jgi:hypothetical protein